MQHWLFWRFQYWSVNSLTVIWWIVIDPTDTPTNIGDNGQVTNLVNVKNLVKYFPVRGGILKRVVAQVQAVDDVSFTVREGETLGLVGESGCGKSTVGNWILRLLEPTSGTVEIDGQNVFELKSKAVKSMRR